MASKRKKNKEILNVAFFCTEQGREPVREWLKSLSKEQMQAIGTDICTVQLSWPTGMPLVDGLGDGLWEVRTQLKDNWARVIFCFHNGDMVLLHGFMKKTNKTPAQDIKKAKERMRKLE